MAWPILQAAAGDQRRHDRRPVVAAVRRRVVDARRAAELAPDDRDDVLVHAAVVQILDQVGDAAIELGQLAAQRDEVLASACPSRRRPA